MHKLAIASLLVFFFACGDSTVMQPDEIEAFAPVLVSGGVAHGPVVALATGSGHQLAGPDNELRTFAFTAVKRADGYVTGEFQMDNRSRDVRAHGTVTCLSVDGNLAWVGVVIDWVRADGATSIEPGQARGWLVVDNDEGSAAGPDEISGLRQFDNCEDRPGLSTSPVVAGNIQVMQR